MDAQIQFLLQEPVKVDDGAGGYSSEWTDRYHVWGTLGPASGVAGDYTGKTMQYSTFKANLIDAIGTNLSIGWRLVWGDRKFEVLAILEVQLQITTVLLRSETKYGI